MGLGIRMGVRKMKHKTLIIVSILSILCISTATGLIAWMAFNENLIIAIAIFVTTAFVIGIPVSMRLNEKKDK
jgi:hypothetical protein